MGVVTGPFRSEEEAFNPQGKMTFLRKRNKYKQALPREEKALPYKFVEIWGPSSNLDDLQASGDGLRAINAFNAGYTDQTAVNRAYEKFVEKIHSSAELAMMFAERREACDGIIQRVGTLRRAWLELRRGNFKKFLKTLDVPPKRKHRGLVRVRAKQASAYWLEYWFGWSPLVNGIYDAVSLLDSPYPSFRVVAVGGNRLTGKMSDWQPYDHLNLVRIQADVSVANEMLYRASQFGVVNPAVIAWELVPFSFLVDWFIPIGRYLQSYTDFVGLDLQNAFHTKFTKGTGSYWYPAQNTGYGRLRTSTKSVFVERIMGVPGFVPQWSLPGRLSVTRAATSIALLVSLFIKDRK